jgi:hypothetical protein
MAAAKKAILTAWQGVEKSLPYKALQKTDDSPEEARFMVRPRTALVKTRRMLRCPKCGSKINRQRKRCKVCARVQPKN